MKLKPALPAALALFWFTLTVAQAQAPPDPKNAGAVPVFRFQPADTVALLGGTFLERDYEYGYLETALNQAFPGFALRFRNLGWSADTVWGTSRSYFGPPSEGLDRLRGHLSEIKPTVVLCQYGAAEAWGGPVKVGAFVDGYRALINLVRTAAGQPRLVLLSPVPAENKPPFPNLDGYSANLVVYRDAVRQLAAELSLPFVDALESAKHFPAGAGSLTTNGLHFSENGYRQLATLVPRAFAGAAPDRPVDEKLRALVLEKNRLFFHRWRPANETYLFGFRKHEQGRNASEIPLFDPLIVAKEKEIAAHLSAPRG